MNPQPSPPHFTRETLTEAFRCWQQGTSTAEQEQLLRAAFRLPTAELPEALQPYKPFFESLSGAAGAAQNPPDFRAILQQVTGKQSKPLPEAEPMPAAESRPARDSLRRLFLAAASLLLLCCGWIAGMYAERFSRPSEIQAVQTELQELRSLLMGGAYANASPFDRLRAVETSLNLRDHTDPSLLVQLLSHSLNTDPNPQVRMAAADALSGLADLRLARQALFISLENQRSELVLLHLVGIIEQLQDNSAIPVLQKLLLSETISGFAEKRIQQTLLVLGYQPVHI